MLAEWRIRLAGKMPPTREMCCIGIDQYAINVEDDGMARLPGDRKGRDVGHSGGL